MPIKIPAPVISGSLTASGLYNLDLRALRPEASAFSYDSLPNEPVAMSKTEFLRLRDMLNTAYDLGLFAVDQP